MAFFALGGLGDASTSADYTTSTWSIIVTSFIGEEDSTGSGMFLISSIYGLLTLGGADLTGSGLDCGGALDLTIETSGAGAAIVEELTSSIMNV
jgi:hypothetical protein